MFGTRWTPFNNPVWNQLHQVQHDVNRLLDRWEGSGRQFLGLAEFPAVNLWEEGDAFYLEAELPGLELNDLEIYVTNRNQLTLKGERRSPAPEKVVKHRQERAFGKFARTLTLPVPVDEAAVDARFEHGVLRLRLPKHEGARPRKIEIKG